MTTPCDYEGVCRPDCPSRGDDCDGYPEIMTEEELKQIEREEEEYGFVEMIPNHNSMLLREKAVKWWADLDTEQIVEIYAEKHPKEVE